MLEAARRLDLRLVEDCHFSARITGQLIAFARLPRKGREGGTVGEGMAGVFMGGMSGYCISAGACCAYAGPIQASDRICC